MNPKAMIDQGTHSFSIIDHPLVFDLRLNSFDKTCYLVLSSLVRSASECSPSLPMLAKYMKCSENRVKKSLKALSEAGYIDVLPCKDGNVNMPNTYILLPIQGDSNGTAKQV